MRILAAVMAGLFLLTACATAPPPGKYEAYCRTHARKVTFSGSPDEQMPYLECMKIKGMHEVEVTEFKE